MASIDSPTPGLPELSPADVERAHLGESDNPFIRVLGRHVDVMREHNPDSTDARDAYTEDLFRSSPFELDVQTIIAAWAIGLEEPARTGLSTSFSIPLFAVYSLYEPSRGDVAKEVTSGFIEQGTLPDSFYQDAGHLTYARSRMSRVSAEMTRLSVYVDGVPNAMSEVMRLTKSDKPEDQVRLEELIEHSKSRATPLLSAVRENVTNATIGLGIQLEG